MAQKYPAIPNPTNDMNSVRDVVTTMKQSIEIMTNQRGDPLTSMVSWGDLVRLGLILPSSVPKTGQ